jgi:high-affinity nickel permease
MFVALTGAFITIITIANTFIMMAIVNYYSKLTTKEVIEKIP